MQKGGSGANPLPGGRNLNAEYSTDIYNFNYPNRGTAIIINNIKFNPATRQDDRKGAENDAQNMHDTFKFLGFNVKPFTDLTTTEMLKELQSGKYMTIYFTVFSARHLKLLLGVLHFHYFISIAYRSL